MSWAASPLSVLTTWLLVTMWPLSSMMNPVPTPALGTSWPNTSRVAVSLLMWTTDGRRSFTSSAVAVEAPPEDVVARGDVEAEVVGAGAALSSPQAVISPAATTRTAVRRAGILWNKVTLLSPHQILTLSGYDCCGAVQCVHRLAAGQI